MNDEMRLARMDLGDGWIDLGYGEPVVVQEIFHRHFKGVLPTNLLRSQYQPPKGNDGLVAVLEKKYGATVVVTNGAKHGISAVMYALKKLGHKRCMIHSPYWVSTPGLIKDQGLGVDIVNKDSADNPPTAFMITSPNNPDGDELPKEELEQLTEDAKADDVMLIHDAAYYTPIYMKDPNSATKVGAAQIYSFAKMYGLSGLRVGYVVVHDARLLPGIVEFVERSSSGVSTASQQLALAIEQYFERFPHKRQGFESEARAALMASRKELEALDPEVLSLKPCRSNSMFAWCAVGPKFNAEAVKVNVIAGDSFGRPGMVRINLAVKSDLIKAAVERLNKGTI